MPAGSKTDLPLAKAKPISASVITYLRREKNNWELLQPERGVRRCKKLCRHQGQCRRRGRRSSRQRSRDPPAARGEDHGEAGCPPAAHGGRMRGCRDSTCSPWRTPCRSRWRHLKEAAACGKPMLEQVPGRTGGPVQRGAHARAGLLAGLVTPWGTPRWSSLLLKVCTL